MCTTRLLHVNCDVSIPITALIYGNNDNFGNLNNNISRNSATLPAAIHHLGTYLMQITLLVSCVSLSHFTFFAYRLWRFQSNFLLHLWSQFLCLKYFLAKVHTQQNNLLERKTFLELARTHFRDYLEQCAALRIIEDDVLAAEDEEVSFFRTWFYCCYS
jgi:TAP42-like family